MENIKSDSMLIAKIVVAAIAATFFGQAATAQNLSTDSSTPATSGKAAGPAQGNAPIPQSGAEILTPTLGVDFTPYMRRVRNDIQRNWNPLIPGEVLPPQNKKGIVSIRFTILPDGGIGMMKLETRSGDENLDKAAWGAIAGEGSFPALPRAFHGPLLELRVGFFYNTPVPSTPATLNSPEPPNR